MANTDQEIIQLVIDAKNLTSDELNKAASDVQGLGQAARKTEAELAKLKIKQDTLESYNKMTQTIRESRAELAKAEVAHENLTLAVKANKNATDAEREAVKISKREVAALGTVLRGQETSYRNLGKKIAGYNIELDKTVDAQNEVANEVEVTTKALTQAQNKYKEYAAQLKVNYKTEKESLDLTKAKADELEQLVKAEEKALTSAKKQADADNKAIAEKQRVVEAIKAYEASYITLTDAREKSTLSNADFIRKEAELRNALELTENQVKTSKLAINAESKARTDAAKAIDDNAKATKSLAKELDQLVASEQRALEKSKAKAKVEADAVAETKRVEQATKEYAIEIRKLIEAKNSGTTSNTKFINQEKKLRSQLNLTEKQVKETRKEEERLNTERINAARSTDLLTTATRRLAQIYTVVIAAQKAAQAVGAGVKEYGELEAAITKVEKTTGLARTEIESMAEQLQDLASNVTPTATNELLKYGEVAGQLGVKTSADLMNIVSAADALGLSTNLAGDEAVELLARMLQMTGEGIPSIHNLSSAVVELGNNFAVSEADIAHMTKEIISGTREIDLGSAAAAAFGTVLKELGQPAERSRTAVQRLSGAIKAASLDGGEDLERLMRVTGLTADEIEKNLGERPEEVLISFLEGLQGISDSGGQMSKVLQSMGIDGTEAFGVLSVLSGGTERLRDALELSNKAYIAGDAHIKEATKSYANQDAAIARVINKFTQLTAAIGEAYSPAVNDAVNAFGDAITDNELKVVSLMEYIPLLVDGIGEMAVAMTDFSNTFSDAETIGGIEYFFESFNVLSLALSSTLYRLRIEFLEVGIAVTQVANQIKSLSGFKVDTSGLRELITKLEVSKSKVVEINNAMLDSTRRVNGESSLAYDKLIDTVSRYGLAIESLTPAQQAEIELITAKTGYMVGEDALYRKIAASIINANRQLEIEAIQKQKALDVSKEKAAVDAAAAAVTQDAINAQDGLNISLEQYTEMYNLVGEEIDKVRALREKGTLTDEQAVEVIDRLNQSLNQYLVKRTDVTAAEQSGVVSATNYKQIYQSLVDEYNAGRISADELSKSHIALAQSLDQGTNVIHLQSERIDGLSAKHIKLNKEYADAKKAVADLTRQSKQAALADEERTRIVASLAQAQQRLTDIDKDRTRISQIETKNIVELTAYQRELNQELANINGQFERGTITRGEYNKKTEDLIPLLNELNGILPPNTDELDKNNTELERRNKLLGIQVEETPKVVKALSLELEAASHLGKAYDFTGQSVEELNKRYGELQSKIIQNDRVMIGWTETLARVSNEVFQQEQAVISQTLRLRKLQSQVESGSLSMEQLGDMTKYANTYFNALSDNQLAPLISAIDTAKAKFQSLKETIDDTLIDIEDRLDAALGNQSAIVKRQYAREVEELKKLINQAAATGNDGLVSSLNNALRKLTQAQKLEYEAEFGKGGYKPTSSSNTNGQGTVTTPNGTYEPKVVNSGVVLVLQVGSNKYETKVDSDVLEQLQNDIAKQNRLR